MERIESPVTLYLNHKIDLVKTCAAIRKWVDEHSDARSRKHAEKYLEELYKKHSIGEHVQKKLLQAVHYKNNVDREYADDDETVMSTPVDISEDETVVVVPQADAATMIASMDEGDDDATVIVPRDEATTFSTTNIDTSFYDSDHDEDELGPGSVLKDRFNLVSVLGEGGMGRVYKAIDMLKVEAKDSNPYVAIKLLTGDFKEHPDAFIALQRETSKAQKLAHPNISTVFDFDRHDETVYMTMELLEGVPLDQFIKRIPEGGLDVEHALGIVQDLGAGLAYAHQQGLVHSDFKPGNAFLLDDGSVKVIDFGIARAAALGTETESSHEDDSGESPALPTPAYVGAADVSMPSLTGFTDGTDTNTNTNTNTNTDTSTTGGTTTNSKYHDDIFDAGSLGALTPAYATIEMFEGKAPHPSDDIYALACVAVQLLTGKHPFKKKSAPKAREAKMKPPVIDGLTSRQQRALEDALAFTRKKRTQSMEEFLDGMRKRKSYVKQIVLGTAASLAIIAAVGYKPVTDYYEQKEIEELITLANSGSENYVRSTLDSLDSYPLDKQLEIKSGIRDRALQIFLSGIQASVDFENEVYDFDKVDTEVKQALSFYPDSSAIKELNLKLQDEKQTLIDQLVNDYYVQLLAKNFYPVAGQQDMSDVLRKLNKLNAGVEAIKDPRLENGYYLAAIEASNAGDFGKAMDYLDIAQQYLPWSKLFPNLQDKVIIQRLTDEQQRKLKQIRIPTNAVSIEAYGSYTKQLELMSLPSENTPDAYGAYLKLYTGQIDAIKSGEDGIDTAMLSSFAPTLTITTLTSLNNATSTQAEAGNTKPVIDLPSLDFIGSETSLVDYAQHFRTLKQALMKYRNGALVQYNLEYSTLLDSLEQSQRHELIAFYNRIYKDLFIDDTVKKSKQSLQIARNAYEETLAKSVLLADVENDKRIFRNIAAQNRLNDSIQTYEKILKNSDDEAFLDFARNEISRMYLTLAESSATEQEYDKALDYTLSASKYVKNNKTALMEKEFRKEVTIAGIPALVVSRDEELKQQAIKDLATLRKEYPDDYPFFLNRIAAIINEDIIILANEDILDAHRLKDHALSIVNSRIVRNVNIEPLPEPSKLALQGKIEVQQKKLTAAQNTYNVAVAETPGHYQVDELKVELDAALKIANDYYKNYNESYSDERYVAADKSLNLAIDNWVDSASFKTEREYYDRVMRQYIAKAKLCREDIQGLGKQSRGVCNDILLGAKAKAPTMVVVPAASSKDEPYAIGKFEISTAELNLYCKSTDRCSSRSELNPQLPAINVPLSMIQNYTEWLSQQTGFRYSLANKDEWVNAASAGGREGNSNYNCRLRLGSKLIKGQNIVPVISGTSNNWGLINYVGNADELVRDGDNYELMGGNFTDSISDCKVTLSKAADATQEYSGFRLARSLQ